MPRKAKAAASTHGTNPEGEPNARNALETTADGGTAPEADVQPKPKKRGRPPGVPTKSKKRARADVDEADGNDEYQPPKKGKGGRKAPASGRKAPPRSDDSSENSDPEEGAQSQQKGKRVRARKSSSKHVASAESEEHEESTEEAAPVNEDIDMEVALPKKRGRPKKVREDAPAGNIVPDEGTQPQEKRGRGRPKKTVTEAPADNVDMEDGQPKRGRGRPKGSKSKPKEVPVVEVDEVEEEIIQEVVPMTDPAEAHLAAFREQLLHLTTEKETSYEKNQKFDFSVSDLIIESPEDHVNTCIDVALSRWNQLNPPFLRKRKIMTHKQKDNWRHFHILPLGFDLFGHDGAPGEKDAPRQQQVNPKWHELERIIWEVPTIKDARAAVLESDFEVAKLRRELDPKKSFAKPDKYFTGKKRSKCTWRNTLSEPQQPPVALSEAQHVTYSLVCDSALGVSWPENTEHRISVKGSMTLAQLARVIPCTARLTSEAPFGPEGCEQNVFFFSPSTRSMFVDMSSMRSAMSLGKVTFKHLNRKIQSAVHQREWAKKMEKAENKTQKHGSAEETSSEDSDANDSGADSDKITSFKKSFRIRNERKFKTLTDVPWEPIRPELCSEVEERDMAKYMVSDAFPNGGLGEQYRATEDENSEEFKLFEGQALYFTHWAGCTHRLSCTGVSLERKDPSTSTLVATENEENPDVEDDEEAAGDSQHADLVEDKRTSKRQFRFLCSGCKDGAPAVKCYGDKLADCDPIYLCLLCYHKLHYSKEGVLLPNNNEFRVFNVQAYRAEEE